MIQQTVNLVSEAGQWVISSLEQCFAGTGLLLMLKFHLAGKIRPLFPCNLISEVWERFPPTAWPSVILP